MEVLIAVESEKHGRERKARKTDPSCHSWISFSTEDMGFWAASESMRIHEGKTRTVKQGCETRSRLVRPLSCILHCESHRY